MAVKHEEASSFLRSRSAGAPAPPRSSCSAAADRAAPSVASLLAANLTPRVQLHLLKVYATLLLAVACAAAGAAFDSVVWQVGGMITTLGALAAMGLLATTPAGPTTLRRRTLLLCLFSALQGASLGPLLNLAIFVDPSLVAVAFGGAALVFASFSLAALVTRRRWALALTGVLSTAVTSFLWLHAAAYLLPRSAFMLRALSLELYLGTCVFAGFVLVDTQRIVEKASAGSDDHVAHALDLFVDLVALFARLLAILVRNAASRGEGASGSDERRERERRRRQQQQQGGVSAARGARRF
jgi:FtsH-binding integral membrane protein